MSILNIRRGNDIAVTFSIMDGDAPHDMTAATGISVSVSSANHSSKIIPVNDLDASGNPVSFVLRGIDQLDNRLVPQDLYRVTVSFMQDGGYHTLDAVGFRIVNYSSQTGIDTEGWACPNVDVTTLSLSSQIALGGTFDHSKLTAESRALPGQHPISAITGLQDALDAKDTAIAAVEQDISDIKVEMVEVREIAEGAATALVFETEAQLNEWIAGTYERPDGKTPADLKIGQHLLIEELDVPDYWWNGTGISPLETPKVDLTDYYNKSQTDLLLADKSGIYHTTKQIVTKVPITDIKVGDNLRGKTITFENTYLPVAFHDYTALVAGGAIGIITGVNLIYAVNPEQVVVYQDNTWLVKSITMPNDRDYIITTNSLPAGTDGSWGFDSAFINTYEPQAVAVDCEYLSNALDNVEAAVGDVGTVLDFINRKTI